MSATGRSYPARNGDGDHQWIEHIDTRTGEPVAAEPVSGGQR